MKGPCKRVTTTTTTTTTAETPLPALAALASISLSSSTIGQDTQKVRGSEDGHQMVGRATKTTTTTTTTAAQTHEPHRFEVVYALPFCCG